MENQKLVFERTYDAPVEKVWQAITDPKKMKQWYFPMMESFKPEVGFETAFDVIHNGKIYPHLWKVTEAIPNKIIAYTWKYAGFPGNSIVSFELKPMGEKTMLTLTQTFTESFEAGQYPDFSNENFIQGWTHFVSVLQTFVEKNS